MRLVWCAIAFCVAAVCAAEQPADFAFSAPLSIDQRVAAYQSVLTVDAYRHAAYADLRDLRVFNGAGEIVPFALRRPPIEAGMRRPLVSVPIFPLRGDAEKALDALRVIVTRDGGSIKVQAPALARPASPAPLRGYLVDLREQKESIVAVELDWTETAPEFAGAVAIAQSDDLSVWRTVASNAPVVNLQFAGQQLLQRRVEFSPARAKFLRITWASTATPIPLQGLSVEPVSRQVDPQRVEVESISDVRGSDGYEFDIGLSTPIDRIAVRLPEPNSVLRTRLWSRPDARSQWSFVIDTTLYRLQRDDREMESPAIVIGSNSDRHWKMTVDSKNGMGAGVPRLRAAWIPAQLIFVARGAPPFNVSVGSNLAGRADTSLDSIVALDADTASANRVVPGVAHIGDFVELGGRSKLRQSPPTDWKNWLLWAVLLVGVALLGFMARRLLREMGDKS